jgi:DNA-binding Xre family transcriptional regulator
LHPILDFHVDHVMPFSKGGSDDLSNLAASCRRCNIAKRDRMPPKSECVKVAASDREVQASDLNMQTLRAARRSRAWSIREFAKRAGVSPQTVVTAEHGKPIRLESIRKMADALGVQPNDIDEFRAVIEDLTPD